MPTKANIVSEYEVMKKRQCQFINLVCALRSRLSYRIASGREMQNMMLYCHKVCVGRYIIYNGV